MFNNHGKGIRRVGKLLLVLTLIAMLPLTGLAQAGASAADATSSATTPQNGPQTQQGGSQGGTGGGAKRINALDLSTLTQEQRATYDSALTLYRQIEDAVLADLVAAAAVTQTDVDAYVAMRNASGSLGELDMSAWTAAQYKAYYEALQKTGDDRTAALNALVAAGQLTQTQADAINGTNASDLWENLAQNARTNSAIKTALGTLQQAEQTLRKTLRDAGINGLALGDAIGSLRPAGRGNGGPAGQNGNGPVERRDDDREDEGEYEDD